MPELTTEQAIEIGLNHHRAGQFRQAEQIYFQVLKYDPRNADALHLLGVLAHQGRRSDAAVELISRAIVVKPEIPVFHYNLAEAYRGLGRDEEAVASYRKAIDFAPDYAEAHNNLGNALVDLRRFDEAADACRRAIEIDPNSAPPHNNLGNALRLQGRLPEAIAEYHQALKLRAEFPEALNNLGIALAASGELEEAMTAYRSAIQLRPTFAEAHNNLGSALIRRGRQEEAAKCFRTAVELKPDFADAHNNLGAALKDHGRADLGTEAYRKAISLRPGFPEAYNNLGSALKDMGNLPEAEDAIRKSIALKPDFADAHCNLGVVLRDMARTDEAVESLKRALELRPHSAEAHSVLGYVLLEQGKLDEAIATSRRAIELKTDAQAHSNLLLSLNYHPGYTSRQVFEEHARFGDVHAGRWCTSIPPHRNDRSPDRRLRIGYVSPDFRGHSVSYFILPVLENHDRDNFEVFCYAHLARPDDTTLEIQSHVDQWRQITGLQVQQIAEMIRSDQIDILVDLAGHTANNALPVFTCKPAPVQVSWIGYPNTTGLRQIDYRISDPYCDPPGKTEQLSTEELLRMPRTAWCFKPKACPEIGALPADEAGHVTFASVNNFAKCTPQVLEAWASILRQVPDSRLLIKSTALGQATTQKYVRELFSAAGITPDRLTLSGWGSLEEFFATLACADIAMDPFPFNGGTTTCQTLWAGLPVISVAGETHVSRMGLSILSNVGLDELVAAHVDDYVKLAVALAQDQTRLRELRRGLRERVRGSALVDGKSLTREVESAYRSVWRRWCENSQEPE